MVGGTQISVTLFAFDSLSRNDFFFGRLDAVVRLKRDEIYGNFPSAETAFPRHYALWQYFVMTIFGRKRSWKNGLKITASSIRKDDI